MKSVNRDRDEREEPDRERGFSPPVRRLLSYGDPRDCFPWPDYAAKLGLTQQHVPELIRMAADIRLWAEQDEMPEGDLAWAGSVHAWRALGQLGAQTAVGPLLDCLAERDEEDDDWYLDEIPQVMALIGPEAIAPVAEYLADQDNPEFPRVCTASCLSAIPRQHPEFRERCVEALRRQLAEADRNGETVNAFVVSALVDLKAAEAGPEIKRAYVRNLVDPTICGDWTKVRNDLGISWEQTQEDPSPLVSARPLAERQAATASALGGLAPRPPMNPLESSAPAHRPDVADVSADVTLDKIGKDGSPGPARAKPSEKDKRKRKQARKDRARNRKRGR